MERKTDMIVMALLSTALAWSSTGEFFAEMMGAPARRATNRASYEMEWTEKKPIKGSSGSFRPIQQKLEVVIPDETHESRKWRYGLNVEYNDWKSSAPFPNGRSIPRSLWNVEASLSHQRTLLNDRKLGVALSLGSAADRPFHGARDLFLQNTIAYRIPKGEEASWIFFLSFSNNRGFLNWVPIPGFVYSFRPLSNLSLGLGLPFFTAFWTPMPKMVVNFTYFPLYNAQFRVAYFLFGPAHFFFQARQEQQTFALHNRTASKERLFHQRGIMELGFVMPLERQLMLEGNGGVSFERRLFMGEKSSAYKDAGMAGRQLARAPYASLKLTAAF
jgi:hypothetical protein